MNLDEQGCPIVPLTLPKHPWLQVIFKLALNTIVFPICFIPLFLDSIYKTSLKSFIKNMKDAYHLVTKANTNSILDQKYNTSPKYMSKLWSTKSAQQYIQNNALEYQVMEGHCGPCTLRNILKSYANIPRQVLPPTSAKPFTPKSWNDLLQRIGQEHECKLPVLEAEIVSGEVDFETWLNEIKSSLQNEKCRVAVNYLRSALVGWKRGAFIFIPVNSILSLISGHFSPVVGMLEKDKANGIEEDLIGVFDVNAEFGAYLVPARILYDSIHVHDLTTGKSRAMVIVKNEGKLD